MKKILLPLLAIVMSASAAQAFVLKEKTELTTSDIAWIQKHRADKDAGNDFFFTWVRIDGKIYATPTRQLQIDSNSKSEFKKNFIEKIQDTAALDMVKAELATANATIASKIEQIATLTELAATIPGLESRIAELVSEVNDAQAALPEWATTGSLTFNIERVVNVLNSRGQSLTDANRQAETNFVNIVNAIGNPTQTYNGYTETILDTYYETNLQNGYTALVQFLRNAAMEVRNTVPSQEVIDAAIEEAKAEGLATFDASTRGASYDNSIETTTHTLTVDAVRNGVASLDLSNLNQNVFTAIAIAAGEAWEDGYSDGYSDGYADGYRDGFADGVAFCKLNK